MLNRLKQIVFYYNPTTPLTYNLGFFIIRFFVGLALCTVFEKLFPKNGIWGPQDWFIQDVATMGFPFPEFFAWATVLVEFFGGLFLILGFLTRPAAILNAIVTFVAAFVYHNGDIGQSGLTAFLFLIMCICISLFGGGKFGLDYYINLGTHRKSLKVLILIPLLAFGCSLEAQTVPASDLQKLNGNWKGQLTYTDYKDDVSQTELNCELQAKWLNKKGTFTFIFIEPNGQVIKDKTKIKLIKGGTLLKFDGKYSITGFSKNEDSSNWELTVARSGKDNNENAQLKLIIRLSPSQLMITKFVKYDASSDFFIRNYYKLERKDE